MNQFVETAAEWFIANKAPELEWKVRTGIANLKHTTPFLATRYKCLFGFMLFSYMMHQGPSSFEQGEDAAREIGVLDEMAAYAADWLKTTKNR